MYMKQVLFYFGCSKWLRSMLVNHWNHIHKWSFQEICNASPPPHSPPLPSPPPPLQTFDFLPYLCLSHNAPRFVLRREQEQLGRGIAICVTFYQKKKVGYMALQMENTCLLCTQKWIAFALVPNFSLRPCLKFFRMPQRSPLQRAGELQGRPRGQDTDIQTFAQNIYILLTFFDIDKDHVNLMHESLS